MGLVIAIGACAGEDSGAAPIVAGIYQVTSHTESTSCDGAGQPSQEPYVYVRLNEEMTLGTPYLSFGDCTGVAAEECNDFGLAFAFFDVDGVWTLAIASASGGVLSNCTLSYTRGTIDGTIDADGKDGLFIEIYGYRDTDGTLDGDSCTAEAAFARGTTMPCTLHTTIAGVKVAEP